MSNSNALGSVARIGLTVVGGLVGASFGNPAIGLAIGPCLGATLMPSKERGEVCIQPSDDQENLE